MQSLEYLKDMLLMLDKEKLIDLIDYIRYIARDNKEFNVDNFLEELQEEIENVSRLLEFNKDTEKDKEKMLYKINECLYNNNYLKNIIDTQSAIFKENK